MFFIDSDFIQAGIVSKQAIDVGKQDMEYIFKSFLVNTYQQEGKWRKCHYSELKFKV